MNFFSSDPTTLHITKLFPDNNVRVRQLQREGKKNPKNRVRTDPYLNKLLGSVGIFVSLLQNKKDLSSTDLDAISTSPHTHTQKCQNTFLCYFLLAFQNKEKATVTHHSKFMISPSYLLRRRINVDAENLVIRRRGYLNATIHVLYISLSYIISINMHYTAQEINGSFGGVLYKRGGDFNGGYMGEDSYKKISRSFWV